MPQAFNFMHNMVVEAGLYGYEGKFFDDAEPVRSLDSGFYTGVSFNLQNTTPDPKEGRTV